jgi:uncharacterized protein (TIGR03083 family)
MIDTRKLFGESVAAVGPLLEEPALVERFDRPSALAEFSVRGLAGHLLRALTSVDGYLDAPSPDAGTGADGGVISPAEYYAAVSAAGNDLQSEAARAIRQRGVEAASGSPAEFLERWRLVAGRLPARLAAEPADRLVQVYGGLVLRLDDYLVTRIIEVVVHADDLAASLGVEPPPFPPDATGVAIATLVDVARSRHGDAAVLRALTRRERDAVAALRVL